MLRVLSLKRSLRIGQLRMGWFGWDLFGRVKELCCQDGNAMDWGWWWSDGRVFRLTINVENGEKMVTSHHLADLIKLVNLNADRSRFHFMRSGSSTNQYELNTWESCDLVQLGSWIKFKQVLTVQWWEAANHRTLASDESSKI